MIRLTAGSIIAICIAILAIITTIPGEAMENKQIIALGVKLSKEHAPKAKYAVIVDFTKTANVHRLFLIDVQKESIEYSWYTSHGAGSGGLSKAVVFSNVPNSHKSSKGLMRTKGTYYGKNGYSLRLEGLEKGVNDNVEDRVIVIHPAKYVSSDYMNKNQYPGRSYGCITLDPDKSARIIDKIDNGSIVYVIG